ncbi:arginine--tRNA ligase [bacterium]|nr:arginine--tRNA ligase [bacterium]MCB2201985.1 arginine--tRNA ligase [bacterium]
MSIEAEQRDKYKTLFAQAVARAFQEVYPEQCAADSNAEMFSPEALYGALEKPRDASMGRFALPVFRFLKVLRQKPADVSAAVAEATNRILVAGGGQAVFCEGVAGYLNARIDQAKLAGETIRAVLSEGASYGSTNAGAGQTQLVEYSSPNIAKPFGIGHLRTTVIGNSLRRIFRKQGYEVVGINYPGDWGTQFGKMIVAYRMWGTPETLEGESVKNLLDLYVRFHVEAESDESLNDRAREAFRKLEDGDTGAVRLWEEFKKISFAEFNRVYDSLGIEFDLVIGESFFNDKMEAAVARLEKAGLTKVSQGALIVDLEEYNLPPALLRKADGATLYMTRDIAGLIWRWEKYHFHESLYVVGSAQADHFRQALKVIELLEEAEGLPPDARMTGRVHHIEFGWVRFGGRMMATRMGNIVFLDDVISQAVALARERIKEKNPELAEIDETAHMIGTGAVIFGQMSARRQRDIDFNWDEVLNFEGETGPYLQYTHARLCSLLRKFGGEVGADVDFSILESEEEQRVVELLADFPVAIADAARTYEPFVLTTYLLKLASAYNKVYQRRDAEGRIVRIIDDSDTGGTAARVALVKAVQTVMHEGLYLLGLQAPQEM